MTILLIDDDEIGLRVRAQLLQVSGYQVHAAATGREGLQMLRDLPIDAAVVDYHLPDIVGTAMIHAMRELRPDVPLVLLTGQFFVPEELHLILADFITKGAGARRLLDSLAALNRPEDH